jgi:hypothetical protein
MLEVAGQLCADGYSTSKTLQISRKGLYSAASGSSNSTSLRLTSLTALAENFSETLEFQKKGVF